MNGMNQQKQKWSKTEISEKGFTKILSEKSGKDR